MAHFAQIDENSQVVQTIVISNDVLNNLEFPQSEPIGVAFCKSLYGENTVWLQCSYNNNFRKQYATVGSTYIKEKDIFILPKPVGYPSWILNDDYDWVPPIQRPTDTVYWWNEKILSWVAVPKPYPSWVAVGDPLIWKAPIPQPDGNYVWDEPSLSWVNMDADVAL
jgi:hypothetical protein